MEGIVKAGNLPNTTSLLNLVKGTPGSALAQSAKSTWFVPTAKNWTNVESSNVLRTMLTNILTGKQTVRSAAKSASDKITDDPERGNLIASRRTQSACRAIRFPRPRQSDAAGAAFGQLRRRRRLDRARVAQARRCRTR